MDRIPRLFAAARGGDVAALQQLLSEDPQILERVASSTIYTETPLHVAALAGKTHFARELITLMPSLAMEKNQEGLIPLHIASARGNLDMVRDLLTLGSSREQCLLKDQGGRIPLHDAIIKGKVPVIELLISHCAESVEQVTERDETVFHLAAMNNQSEALQVVTERMKQHPNFMTIFNSKDKGGNNFWDLGQRQIRENKEGSQNAMQIVAGLIVTATYQACLSPPSTIWKEGRKLDQRCIFKANHFDMKLPPNICPAAAFYWFMLFNTTGFMSAFTLILVRQSPTKKILLIVSIYSLVANYLTLLEHLCPDRTSSYILTFLSIFIVILGFVVAKQTPLFLRKLDQWPRQHPTRVPRPLACIVHRLAAFIHQGLVEY